MTKSHGDKPASAQTGDSLNSSEFPHLEELDGILVPAAPRTLVDTGVDKGFLLDLALKTAHQAPTCNTRWVAQQMRLPAPLAEELLQELARDRMLEVLSYESMLNHVYRTTDRGHDRTTRLLSTSRYVGPAPVSVERYTAMTELAYAQFPETRMEDITYSLAELRISEKDIEVLAMATMSGRSLFLWGPPGNGKTTVARALHRALQGEIWIPYCLVVGNDVVKVFDPHLHHESNFEFKQPWNVDGRWVRIQRPLIVTGGEMTLESLELAYTTGVGHYEVPAHVKANGGLFVIDDFGRQRADSWKLLNRWIVPMEHGFDYFTLQSGQRVTLPFKQMLIIATNIDPNEVMDPAFLRRMGYKLHLGPPSQQRYREIFLNEAKHYHLEVSPMMLDLLLNRYDEEGRTMRGCEPRDLLRRVKDACQMRGIPMQLNGELIDTAWRGYFGAIPDHNAHSTP